MHYKNNNNKFSTGCQLCQKGQWLCIFITYKCTAGCKFCPAPQSNDTINSAFGSNKEQVLQYLQKSSIKGLSYSGGDPFLVFDRMLEWQQYFFNHFPKIYYWVYTNGLQCNADMFKKLTSSGVSEIRFNIAASGYLNTKVWKQIELARKHFKFVGVEIPSILAHQTKLLKALKMANATKIDYLNLHDYIITDKEASTITEPTKEYTLNFTNELRYAPLSKINTREIISRCKYNGYGFTINHCSMQQKEKQMLQRRLKTGKLFQNTEYDSIQPDGTIVNYFKFPKWFTKDQISEVLFMQPKKQNAYIIPKNILEKTLLNPYFMLVETTSSPKIAVNENKTVLEWCFIHV